MQDPKIPSPVEVKKGKGQPEVPKIPSPVKPQNPSPKPPSPKKPKNPSPKPPSPKKPRGQPRSKKDKGLAKNKKHRAPGKQPICGLYAAARCAGIPMKTAANVEAFRNLCFDKIFKRPKNWIGGTTGEERRAICTHFRCEVSDVLLSHPEYVGKTVGTLFKDADFFKTKEQYMLTVPKHCVWVRTNGEKKKLEVRDQSGKPFRPLKDLSMKKPLPPSMIKLLKQHLTSLTLVTQPPAAAPPAAAPPAAAPPAETRPVSPHS
jgi:hypothetical protein